MNVRDLIDQIRLHAVSSPTLMPTRLVTYTRSSDLVPTEFNSYVGVGAFTKTERETIGMYESFGGLALITPPAVMDIISYGGIDWRVTRWTKLGSLYTVYAENKRHNGRPTP